MPLDNYSTEKEILNEFMEYSSSFGVGGGMGAGTGGNGGSVTAKNGQFNDDGHNIEFNLRRRKGRIISCAKDTISHVSKQLRQRVPYADHLMTPQRLWLNKIPTQCDIVIEFPDDAPVGALNWLLSRISSQPPDGLGLLVDVKQHETSKRTAFYVTAPFNVIFQAAEEARLPKRLCDDLGGTLREFTARESHCFAYKRGDFPASLFTSQERQWLVLKILQELRAGELDVKALQGGKAYVIEGQSIVTAWKENGIIVQVFPLHELDALTKLQKNWVLRPFSAQPLDDISEYFGVKVALYFAWLGHYTCALGVPAIFGMFLWLFLYGRTQLAQDIGHVLFSLFNVVWASLYLEAWRRYSVELAYRWGTLSTPPELLEPPRPLYRGPLVESPLTGKLEPQESDVWRRRAFRYFISFPVIGLCLLLVFIVMFLMLRLQDWADEILPESGIISWIGVIPKFLLAGAITLMDEAYFKVALWLNEKENYRLQSKYENHLIAKVALFQFVNSFLSLFYIAFYLRDQDKLKEQLAGLLISRQIIGNLRESVYPYFMEQLKFAQLSFSLWGSLDNSSSKSTGDRRTTDDATPLTTSNDNGETDESSTNRNGNGRNDASGGVVGESNEIDDNGCDTENKQKQTTNKKELTTTDIHKRNINQAEIESSLYVYDGTFSDHLEMLVQMGYVVLFSSAFPLAGLCALANNLLEIRSDAFKLAHVHQRPFGQRVANIGTWQNALSILGFAAVAVNCALIGLSGQVARLWPGLTSSQTIILIVALEHIMIGLRMTLTWFLPELPSWLEAEIARAEHYRREIQFNKGNLSSPYNTTPTVSRTSLATPLNNPNDEILIMPTTNVSTAAAASSVTAAEFMINTKLVTDADEIVFQHIAPLSPKFDKQNSSTSKYNVTVEDSDFMIDNNQPLVAGCTKDGSNKNTSLEFPQLDIPSPFSSSLGRSQIIIPEIPPFKKPSKTVKSTSNTTFIPEIPAFNYAKKRDLSNADIPSPSPKHQPSNNNHQLQIQQQQHQQHQQQQQQQQQQQHQHRHQYQHQHHQHQQHQHQHHEATKPIPIQQSTNNASDELQIEQSEAIRRSIECINKQEGMSSVKPAPSWNNLRTELSSSAPVKLPGEEDRDAELAAKKSRIKQSLIKRARSVAIFSLKLKEKRARDAEKQLAEHERVVNAISPPGGELDIMGIEHIIHIDDVVRIGGGGSGGGGSSNDN